MFLPGSSSVRLYFASREWSIKYGSNTSLAWARPIHRYLSMAGVKTLVIAFDDYRYSPIDRLELPLTAEVITRYKNEVFGKEPLEQHLNFRRLTLPKEVLGDSFKTFMDTGSKQQ